MASLTFVSIEGMRPYSAMLVDETCSQIVRPDLDEPLEAHRQELCSAYRSMVQDFDEMYRNLRHLPAVDKARIIDLHINLYNGLFVGGAVSEDAVVSVLQNELPVLRGELSNLYREKMGLPRGDGAAGGPQN